VGARSWSTFIEGKPHPKERPRPNGRGGVYTPERTKRAEAHIAAHWDGPTFVGPVEVQLIFNQDGTAVIVTPLPLDMKSGLRGDLDNLAKTVLDGLNGVAWGDDRQVLKITAVKA
jgi:crossover junction endodeoxyribonuclease RusA